MAPDRRVRVTPYAKARRATSWSTGAREGIGLHQGVLGAGEGAIGEVAGDGVVGEAEAHHAGVDVEGAETLAPIGHELVAGDDEALDEGACADIGVTGEQADSVVAVGTGADLSSLDDVVEDADGVQAG